MSAFDVPAVVLAKGVRFLCAVCSVFVCFVCLSVAVPVPVPPPNRNVSALPPVAQVRHVESAWVDHFDAPGVYDAVMLAIAPRTRAVVGTGSSIGSTSSVERVSCARLWPFVGQPRSVLVASISRRQEPSPAPFVQGGWYRWCRDGSGDCVLYNAEDIRIDESGQPIETGARSSGVGLITGVVGLCAAVAGSVLRLR
jgi:hypothetical protein